MRKGGSKKELWQVGDVAKLLDTWEKWLCDAMQMKMVDAQREPRMDGR